MSQPLVQSSGPSITNVPVSSVPDEKMHLRNNFETGSGVFFVQELKDVKGACSFLAAVTQFGFEVDVAVGRQATPMTCASGASLELPPLPGSVFMNLGDRQQEGVSMVKGIAFSWVDERAIYIDLEDDVDGERWQWVFELICGPVKMVTFGLKPQLKALNDKMRGAKDSCRSLRLGSTIDVKIAAWLLQPDEVI